MIEGDKVKVQLPRGIGVGTIKTVLKGYKQLTKEDCFEVSGKIGRQPFITIASARAITKL